MNISRLGSVRQVLKIMIFMKNIQAIRSCSVSVTTTVFEKTTPNLSPSLSLIGQKPFLTA